MNLKGDIAPHGSVNDEDAIEALRRRLGKLDQRQIAAWREMSPARRLEMAFQAYQFALDAVRLTEQQSHPDLSPGELAWRVTRRMQGNPRLGREDTWSQFETTN
jgi:hypothetical protein